MEFCELELEKLALFTQFYEENPLKEEKEDLQDRLEEIEDELRINKFQYFGFIKESTLLAYGKLRYEGDQVHFIGPFVLPTQRRKGLGRKILEEIENHCRSKGKSRLNAYSFIDTKLAEDFLTKIGYKLESVSELGVNIYIKEL